MKKLLVLLLTATMLFSAAGCGKKEAPAPEADNASANVEEKTEEKLYEYRFDGVTAYLPAGEAEDLEGMNAFYTNDTFLMTGLAEGRELFAEAGLRFDELTAEGYAELVSLSNEIEFEYDTDNNGNLCFTYLNEVDGEDYFYYTSIHKSKDAFWLITFACLPDDADGLIDKFAEYNRLLVFE